MIHHMRTGTYQTHISLQNIQQLGQLVHMRGTQEFADPEYPLVVLRTLAKIRIIIYMHGPELITTEYMSIFSDTILNKKQRAMRRKSQQNIYDRNHYRQYEYYSQC